MYKFTNQFTNFKNFADAQIDLLKPLTILIGKNGSGKTNIIEGIEVFAHLAQGTPLHKFSDVGKGGDCEVRGGLGNCVGFDAADFEMCFNVAQSLNVTPPNGGLRYKIKIGRTAQHESILLEERLLLTSDPEQRIRSHDLFSARRRGDVLKVKYYDFVAGKDSRVSISATRSIMSRYEEIVPGSATKNPEGKSVASMLNNISKYFKTAYIFDTNPKAMRGYERIAAHTELSRDGGNLSAVLYALKKNRKREELKRIIKIVRQLPEEPFSKLDFIKTSANDVMLRFYVGRDKVNKRFFDARMLSDGTLRMLAVLTALETVPEGARIVVEEFDSGLHPSRARLLVKHLYETAERRRLKILVTTHNPAVMNALSEEQMGSVVLCHRDAETGHSKLTPLMEIQDVDLMMLRGNLGDLVTDEIVEKYLSSEFRKERAEIAQKWKERYSL